MRLWLLFTLALCLPLPVRADPWLLFEAAREGKVQKVEELLKGGAPVDELFCGITPLQVAVNFNQTGAAAILLRYKANTEVGSVEGKTPLMAATVNGNVEMVRLLLQAGARPNVRATDGSTALTYGSGAEVPVEIVRLLLAAGAEPNLGTFTKSFPIHMAVLLSSAEKVTALLDGGAKVDVPNQDGLTPLMMAAYWGKLETLKALLSHGARRDIMDRSGRTALDHAIEARQAEAAKLLSGP